MKELKGGIGAFAAVSLGSVAFDRRFGQSAKTLLFAEQPKAYPAVLNHSPIRDPDAVCLLGFGHIVAFGSRLPILLNERNPDLPGSLGCHQDSRDIVDDAPSSSLAPRRS